ncbi:Rid family detoxifying hydrolase [Paenibacillus thiaminolyticus]|uniref:RidA family protein n=1 Tax=Paenibacillus thiaminolyticus TaxID=49283 RepID=A0A3A3GI28_PANTH|nr:Rid family detoxifying hydrolase [Paenibacillus thiaminolyticus]RJG21621.1 hypothetical protein DQX05_20585 [Paenibacillus thiaminolyticus]
MKRINTKKAPEAIGPYVQGVKFNNMIVTSGQLPINADVGIIESASVKEQTYRSLTNIKNILEEGGGQIKDIVKTTVYLQHMDDFAEMNEVYDEFFKGMQCPARTTVEVAKLPMDALVEIEAMAILEGEK